MKNSVFLLIVFVLAIATAYAISQDAASQNPAAATTQVAGQVENSSRVSPNPVPSVGDPLAVVPAPQVQSEIEGAVKRQPGLRGQAIQIKVDDETIELSGTVDSGKDKMAIYRLAESYAMNRRVKDLITVNRRTQPQAGSRSSAELGQASTGSSNSSTKASESADGQWRQVEASGNATAAQR